MVEAGSLLFEAVVQMGKRRDMATPSVTVIGAGIVGAAAAFHLSRAGAAVRLIDRRAEPGRGVTGQSFGWVNYITIDPLAEPVMYRHRQAAIEKYQKLNAGLDHRLFDRPTGSLVWKASEAETERWVEIHSGSGSSTVMVEDIAFGKLVPAFAAPPRIAAHAMDDIALDAAQGAALFVEAAVEAGAQVHLRQAVDLIDVAGDGKVDSYLGDSRHRSDYVVVAAGAASERFLSAFLPDGSIGESPVALVTIAVERAEIGCILQGPDIEVRKLDDRTLLAVTAAPEDEDDEVSRQYVGQAALEAIARRMPSIGRSRVVSVSVGKRPMPSGGRPLVGPVPGAPSVLAAVAHPGVILAPAIAEILTELVLDRRVSSDFEDLVI